MCVCVCGRGGGGGVKEKIPEGKLLSTESSPPKFPPKFGKIAAGGLRPRAEEQRGVGPWGARAEGSARARSEMKLLGESYENCVCEIKKV